MKILVTGAAGLMGSRFIEHLLCKGHFVIGVDDLSGGYIENVTSLQYRHDKYLFYKMDVLDLKFATLFEKYQPDYVVHFAAYAAEGLSPFIRKFNYTNNLVTTANVVNLCITHHVKRLLFTSSIAVYGEGIPPFDEELLPNPLDPYGVAKYACEMDIRIAGEQHDLDWCILRPHNVIGRNQNIWDNYRNVFGIWMWKHLNNQPLSIFGDGQQKRAFSVIDDTLEPMYIAMTAPQASKQIINLGGIVDYTINDAALMLMFVMKGGTIEYLPPRHEVRYAFPTYRKSADLLGFQSTTSLLDGLTDMWAWACTQPIREKFVWPEYELNVGMYSFWNQENLK